MHAPTPTRRFILAGSLALVAVSARAEAPLAGLAPGSALAVDREGVLDVGAIPGIDLTGSRDVTAPLQAALDVLAARTNGGTKVGGTLRFPRGSVVRVSGTLNYDSDGSLTIIAGNGLNRKGAKIIQEGKVLFNIVNSRQGADASGQNQVEIGGLEIQCMYPGKDGACAFRIYEPESVHAHDIRAYRANGFWSVFFDLRNVRGAVFERMYVRNDDGQGLIGSARGRMFNLTASKGTTDSRYTNMTIQGFEYGWYGVTETAPGVEGQLFEGVSFVECQNGVFFGSPKNGPGAQSPQLQFINGHMNCYRSLLQVMYVSSVILSDCELELNNKFGDINASAAGIHITGCQRFNVHDIFYHYTNGARNMPMIVIDGPSTQGIIHDIKGVFAARNQPAIHLDAQVTNTDVHHVSVASIGGGNFAISAPSKGAGNTVDQATVRVY